jgi:hypothetical protein
MPVSTGDERSVVPMRVSLDYRSDQSPTIRMPSSAWRAVNPIAAGIEALRYRPRCK